MLCSVSTFVLLSSVGDGSPLKAIHQMGYFPVGVEEAVKAVALTAILFIGPLFESGIVEGNWRDWIRLRGLDAVISGWIGWRNIVAVRIPSQQVYLLF